MSGADRIARLCHVRGCVQGVGFRYHTRARAEELGVVGWVRNLPDGAVEAWIEGPQGAVEALLRWLSAGPPSAVVSSRRVEEVPPGDHGSFEVRF